MALNLRNKVNRLFETDEAAKAFDYLAIERKPIGVAQIKVYLDVSMDRTDKALGSLEKQGLVNSATTRSLHTFRMYTITSRGLEKYNAMAGMDSKF